MLSSARGEGRVPIAIELGPRAYYEVLRAFDPERRPLTFGYHTASANLAPTLFGVPVREGQARPPDTVEVVLEG